MKVGDLKCKECICETCPLKYRDDCSDMDELTLYEIVGLSCLDTDPKIYKIVMKRLNRRIRNGKIHSRIN